MQEDENAENAENEVVASETPDTLETAKEETSPSEALEAQENTSETEDEESKKKSAEEKAEAKRKSAKAMKDTAASMGRTILSYIDRGVEASKKGFRTAGSAISDFGDKSVLRIELSQLKAKRAKALNELGTFAYQALLEGKTLEAQEESVCTVFKTLQKLAEDIEKREKALGE